MQWQIRSWGVLTLVTAIVAGCGSDSNEDDDSNTGGRPSENETGAVCDTAAECFPEVAEGALLGEPQCLDRVTDGYCTHLCETDDDCCAVEGECPNDLTQVCSPFESTNQRMCFLSCEQDDVEAAMGQSNADEQEYCQHEASEEFICRSSGGGSQNRKVCVPGNCGIGADCTGNGDCAATLSCLEEFAGGYCAPRGCEGDGDCPEDSACVTREEGDNYCAKICQRDSQCSFCRDSTSPIACSDAAHLVDSSGVSVCLPVAD